MTGFEPGSSDIRSDRAVNTAATTGLIFLIVCFSAMYLHVPTCTYLSQVDLKFLQTKKPKHICRKTFYLTNLSIDRSYSLYVPIGLLVINIRMHTKAKSMKNTTESFLTERSNTESGECYDTLKALFEIFPSSFM